MSTSWHEALAELPATARHFDETDIPLPDPPPTARDLARGRAEARQQDNGSLPPYTSELATLELALSGLSPLPGQEVEEWSVNPSLEVVEAGWQGLDRILQGEAAVQPRRESCRLLLWRMPADGAARIAEATDRDLLALKIVMEDIDTREAAAQGGVAVGTVDDMLLLAVRKGLLLKPASRLRRCPDFPRGEITDQDFLNAQVFTLQWHITHACDLHCKHCYDRAPRAEMERDTALRILDMLYEFCRERHVFGQISFTGGNPLLYPHFDEIYQEAAQRGFLTAILGNPMPEERIRALIAIQRPEFYQISLEGLEEHNDRIRGQGHFRRSLAFLQTLQELDVYSMVMLTLTRDNMDQVIPLARLLKDQVDLFTFNRLSPVGEGAALAVAPPERFPAFLAEYEEQAATIPCMGLKDNFFNLLRFQRREGPFTPFGGCAGHGCGAAFNFFSLLPDGEVHACRKFPSLIGNIHDQDLGAIHDGEAARRYRRGCKACDPCPIRPVCGGCLAVSHGMGQDVFRQRDPYCFLDQVDDGRD